MPLRTELEWRTLETPGFAFHYPAPLEAWTRRQAERMEGVRERVRGLVGHAPSRRVTVLVDDPYDLANGSAYPFLDAPGIFLWPAPPGPRAALGGDRDWSELLVAHEFAHVAHLTRPSRNPLRRLVGVVVPAALSPIAAGSPRWVFEGYATYVEGRLTGGGRPHGAWRPAFLRQWAIEGRLPTYAQVSGSGGFAGGSFAYLAGSAYFEWLLERHAGARGDSALAHLWRRMTARTPRGFDAAFAGVFPGTPAELYSRWTAEVTAAALAQERLLREAGLVEGALVQRLRGYTGDPAVSADGRLVAVEIRSPDAPSRIVVWRTAPDPPDTGAARRAARHAARDPEDVAPVEYLPRPKRALSTLPAVDGRSFTAPRFLADGRRLLVARDEPRPDGTLRADLWLWDRERGGLRRITRGAGVRGADPSPDGRRALGVRCLAGWCDVVSVDLASGAVVTVLAGSADVSYARPRWAPDGARFVVAELRGGRWRPVVARADGSSPRAVGPDDGVDRYEASFLAGEEALVAVAEAGGVPNLERLDLETGAARPLSRVTGAAMAPAAIPGARAVYYLSLRSTGLDVRRLALDTAPPAATVALTASAADTALPEALAARAVLRRLPERVDSLPTGAVGPRRGYGLGPRRYLLLPAAAASADGAVAIGMLSSADPVGRLTWLLQGALGDARSWHGGALSVAVRALGPTIEAQGFGVAQRVAPPGDATPWDIAPGEFRDRFRYYGGTLAVTGTRQFPAASLRGRVGASSGVLDPDAGGATTRRLAFAELRGAVARGRGARLATLTLGAHAGAGRTADSSYVRAVGTATLALRTRAAGIRGDYTRGVVGRGAPAFERFLVGGAEPGLVDPAVVAQRVTMPALPTGIVAGREIETVRAALTGAPLQPYLWAARAPGADARWHRVLGVEQTFSTGAIPFARAPGARLVAGVGWSLDAPLRRAARGYLSVVVRP